MRERPVPCRGATLRESIAGTHKTWADDAYCDRCRVLHALAVAEVRRKQAQDVRLMNAGRWLPGLRPTSPPGGSRRAHFSAGHPSQRIGGGRSFALAPIPSLYDHDQRSLRALAAVVRRVVGQESERFTSTVPTSVGLLTHHH